MKQNQSVRKKMRRQAQIIVALMIAIIICFIALVGFVFFELVLKNQSIHESNSIQTEQTFEIRQTESIHIETTESDVLLLELEIEESIEDTEQVIAPIATVPIDLDGPDLSGYVVVIDPGHQALPNAAQEPIAPWMSGSKDKSSEGSTGVLTSRPEHEVNLIVGLILYDYLKALDAEVYMTRTNSDVDLSNIQRAEIAKAHEPDIYIRLYCNSSDDELLQGMRIFVADSGPYARRLCDWADQLGNLLSDATGSDYLGCDASSRFTGLNWATEIPSFMIRMGYLTNAYDDIVLSDPEYHLKICQAIADFIVEMPQSSNRSS